MTDLPIRVEVNRHKARLPDELFATFDEAAIAAAYAADFNTAWYGEAENVDTGEKRTRTVQLERGFAMIDEQETH